MNVLVDQVVCETSLLLGLLNSLLSVWDRLNGPLSNPLARGLEPYSPQSF